MRLSTEYEQKKVRSRLSVSKYPCFYDQFPYACKAVIAPEVSDLLAADVRAKTRFVIVDAVGVCESDKTDSRPLERKPTVAFKDLLSGVALGKGDDDTLTTLAYRIARLDQLLLRSPVGQAYLTANGAGVGRPNINAPRIEEFFVPLPPLAEQSRILSVVDQLLNHARRTSEEWPLLQRKAESLRQLLLQNMFVSRGEEA